MDDPFPAAQSEATSALTNAQQLFESFLRIKSTVPTSAQSTSEELSYAEAELKAVLSTLGSDVSDLEEAVEALETHGPESFGVTRATVLERRRFVSGIREALDDIRSAMKKGRPLSVNSSDIFGSSRPGSPRHSFRDGSHHGFTSPDLESGRDAQPSGYDMQQQAFIIEQQDTTLTSLGSVVGTLRSQAMSVGTEVMDQVSYGNSLDAMKLPAEGASIRMLGHLNDDVDRSQNRLDAAQKQMAKFLRETRSNKSSCCILVLIIVLCILLVVAFTI